MDDFDDIIRKINQVYPPASQPAYLPAAEPSSVGETGAVGPRDRPDLRASRLYTNGTSVKNWCRRPFMQTLCFF